MERNKTYGDQGLCLPLCPESAVDSDCSRSPGMFPGLLYQSAREIIGTGLRLYFQLLSCYLDHILTTPKSLSIQVDRAMEHLMHYLEDLGAWVVPHNYREWPKQ